MQQGLHADHIDTTGSYRKRFEVIKELVDNGTLTEIPSEFRGKGDNCEVVEVASSTADEEFNFSDDNGGRHADHVDETGRYRRAWEEKFGPLQNSGTDNADDASSDNGGWKDFLQRLISEEKSKLNI